MKIHMVLGFFSALVRPGIQEVSSVSDTLTVGSGTVIGSDAGTAETATPVESTGTETAASENNETHGGGSQESTDDAQQGSAGGRKRWSLQDEVKELRAQRRELREQVKSSESLREELRQLRETVNRPRQEPAAKTPPNFWQDPEGTLEAKLEEKLSRLQEQMFERFSTTREQEYAQQALRQEQATGVEFIRSQKGYSQEDDEDLIEIIEENGLKSLSPMQAARTAWALLQQSRGVGDRSLAKARAAGVQGQAPGAGLGKKVWSKADFDAALDSINPRDPKHDALIKELEAAHKEGRVK